MNKDVGIRLVTSHGYVLGKMCMSVYNDVYYSFERIPYAQSPLGELRFKSPVPIEPWRRQLDCREKGEKPLQKNSFTNEIEGTEDCLYLNIYTKHYHSEKPLPVLIFFFGGGFEKGDPTCELHSPDYFMMKDVIVATVSYRVGPFGFVSLDDPKLGVPGNAGLKDQVLALQWLHQNIENFNGDKDNVTVFGESAGAASVHYHMLNPRCQNLFDKAILMSGNVLCPWALSNVKDLPKRLAVALGCTKCENDADVLEFLQHVPAEDLVRPYLLTPAENLDDSLFQFGPVVEPYITDDCMIPQEPAELLAKAWGNKIPVLMGGTSFEGLLMYARVRVAPFLLLSLKNEPQHMLPSDLKQNLAEERARELGMLLQRTHFGDAEINLDNVLKYCEYASYKVFWHPIQRLINSRKQHARAPTYLYRFDFDSPNFNHQRIKYCGKQQRGVAHVDDHSYLWYGSFSWVLPKDSKEFLTIQRMIDIWTTFASCADPSSSSCIALQLKQHSSTPQIKWKPLSTNDDKIYCLNISEDLSIIELPESKKLEVWQSVYSEMSRPKAKPTTAAHVQSLRKEAIAVTIQQVLPKATSEEAQDNSISRPEDDEAPL